MSTTTTNVEDYKIKSDRIFLLYQDLLSGLLVSLVASAGMSFGFQNPSLFQHKLAWFLAMILVLFIRLLDWAHWRLNRNKPDPKGYNSDLQTFRIGCISTALLWSFYAIYFFDDMSLIEFATTLIILSSLAGGASTVLSADKICAVSYTAILLVPVSLLCLVSEHSYHYVLGMLGLSFAGVMIISGMKSTQFTLQAIKIKHHNEQLVSKKDELLTEINQHNAMLEETINIRTKEVIQVSNIDPLTNLANRKAFSIILKDLITNAETTQQTIAVLFIDLDGFKAINDQNGHATGDIVLARVASRLCEITDNKFHVCRWGGDEFIVAMVDVSINEAKSFALELINRIKHPIDLNFNSVNVGATVGIAIYPDHAQTEDDLILLADTAMYQQKQVKNSNVLVFTEQMREVLQTKNRIKVGLETALAKNQFFVVYQPVIDAQTEKIEFCEALLRWQWNDENIQPDTFIPIAEQYGFIHEIGAWVLEQACQDAMTWAIGENVSISVNVSVAQIMNGDIINNIENALNRSGISPERLHIEITESLFAENLELVISVVRKIQALGAKVSIDDFGTGFSSLALLQNLSADIVKIDRCFVSGLEQGGKAIIQATQHIARDLKYDVVAEGVETAEQVEALKELGIKSLQGFYYSKPLKIDVLNKFALNVHG